MPPCRVIIKCFSGCVIIHTLIVNAVALGIQEETTEWQLWREKSMKSIKTESDYGWPVIKNESFFSHFSTHFSSFSLFLYLSDIVNA